MPIDKLYYSTRRDFEEDCSRIVNEVITSLESIDPPLLYIPEGVFQDTTLQTGSPEDIPKTVTYGIAKDSDNTHISYASGVFTVNTSGYYAIKTRIRASRSGAAQSSSLFFWAEISSDGGNSYTVTGASVDVQLDNAQSNAIFFDFATLYLPAGVKLRSRFARSSTGDDSGNLTPSTPSAALISYGVQPAPSAQLTIYKAL